MADESETRNWLELPRDVTAAIISRVGIIGILDSVEKVCTLWRDICNDPSMWRSVDFHGVGDFRDDYDLEKMCMHAVDLSKGDLDYINIEHFGTDDILAYIAERSSRLRRLRLVSCPEISEKGLKEAIPKLSLLEGLEISYCSFSPASLAVVGSCCPHLKSFKFNKHDYQGFNTGNPCDEAAQAIAQTMRELRHLQLFGNKLSNFGLVAILDGCTHLESLDLRHCFNVALQGNLEKRCVEQIKHLRRPNDSTQDYEFYEAYHKFDSSDEDDLSGLWDGDLMSGSDYDYDLGFSDGGDYPYPYYDYYDFFEDYFDDFWS
ncbi:hypothetical protein SLA2020_397020 [Shorea laevis]